MSDTLKDWEVEIMEATLLGHGDHGYCDFCAERSILIYCESRRMDSDKSYNLCPHCTAEYHERWDEQWEEYYRGRM